MQEVELCIKSLYDIHQHSHTIGTIYSLLQKTLYFNTHVFRGNDVLLADLKLNREIYEQKFQRSLLR
jgi:hypothetical protein